MAASPNPSDSVDIVYYAEEDLVATPGADDPGGRRDGTPEVVRRLVAADGPAARERIVREQIASAGFDWFGYGTVATRHRGPGVPRTFFTTYAHAEWTGRYFAERYHEVDPRHADAPRSGLPLVWSLDDLAERDADPRDASRVMRLLDDLDAHGVRSGMFFQLPSPTVAGERVVLSLMARRDGRGWMGDGVLGQALTLGLCMHEFLSCHVAPAAGPGMLSALQRSILQCLSRGQSDKEIANRLQLSSHAVDYHMRQLRRRFAVHNRVQLVNAAG